MYAENCLPVKPTSDLGMLIVSSTNPTSILEEDLALSTSIQETTCKSGSEDITIHHTISEEKIIYMNEDAMDCCYNESNDTPKSLEQFPEAASPEMFESDAEDELNNTEATSDFKTSNDAASTSVSSQAISWTELVAKSDSCLLDRINQLLTGVPPPPMHTICQSDCDDFLRYINQNRHLFWTNPLEPEKVLPAQTVSDKDETHGQDKRSGIGNNILHHRARSSSRNLTNAFNACDTLDDTTISSSEWSIKDATDCSNNSEARENNSNASQVKGSNHNSTEANSDTSTSSVTSSMTRTEPGLSRDNSQKVPYKIPDTSSLLHYTTTNQEEVIGLSWPEAYRHKYYGIHYNRNRAVEDFENLTAKLCERYVRGETQSTCNIWFTKQTLGSARKRNLLMKRNIGQSPGRRLSHLARRRRTFSSANLQGLGLSDKKQLVLNVKKPIVRKGKSPRRKSPHNSAVKRVARRLSLEGPSPRKSKLESSKRALFQSPPMDRAGPSKSSVSTANVNPQRIKRALFPTPKKKADAGPEETRKRKSEEDLEGPRVKWAKSLSFDCPHNLGNESMNPWDNERHSTGNVLSKSKAVSHQGKCELSDTHRKKLLWAVAEALRSKGIGMGHPSFKQYASHLARTVKKFMPDLENRNIPRKSGSTSDRMLKLAKHHVLLVIDAKSTES